MPEFFFRPVVCNTGPLIGLGRAGLAHLPGEIFPSVIIPETVVAELLARDAGDSGEIAKAIGACTIVQSARAPDPLLFAELDAGEASVIQTARTK